MGVHDNPGIMLLRDANAGGCGSEAGAAHSVCAGDWDDIVEGCTHR